MREGHIGPLPITDDEKLVGMITDRDITTRVAAEATHPSTTSVGDVCSRDPVSVEPDYDLEEALQLMARHQIRRLPVVESGRLVGIVAQADIALGKTRRRQARSSRLSPSLREKSAGNVAQNAFAADFHSRRRSAMSSARSSSLPPSSTSRSEGSARR
jgi:predicted transcriptional regulator